MKSIHSRLLLTIGPIALAALISTAHAAPSGISRINTTVQSHSRVPVPVAGALLTVLSGIETGEQFGVAVSGGADINADGLSDILVGAYQRDSYGAESGGASCFAGPNGSPLVGPQPLNIAVYDYFGQSVALVPDLNADGKADYVIGTPYDNQEGAPTIFDRGSITVFSGATGEHLDIPTQSGTRFIRYGEGVNSQFGYSIASIGDFNADGYPDIAVGAPYESGKGKIYVYSLHDGALLFSVSGIANGERLGFSVAAAGDVNNDGFDDVIAGGDFAGDTGVARVYSGANGSLLHTFFGVESNDTLGRSVGGGFDLNLDGYDDLIIGAPSVGSYDNSGAAYVRSGSDGSLLCSFQGAIGDRLGNVALIEDFNGDANPDIAVGSPTAPNGGKVTVYSGADCQPIVTLTPGIPGGLFGRALASGGDFNGDGFNDLIVGSPGAAVSTGRAYVFGGGI